MEMCRQGFVKTRTMSALLFNEFEVVAIIVEIPVQTTWVTLGSIKLLLRALATSHTSQERRFC